MSRYAVGDRVTIDADQYADPYALVMQSHVLIAVADGDVYLVRRPDEGRKYGPYAESRLTPGWGLAGE